MTRTESPRVGIPVIIREWGRIGVTGFGGPPAHIALLRKLCVDRYQWLSAEEFEDAIAATNLLPGPASTQLAIFCAWRLRGWIGAILGGMSFILPGLILIVALSVVFLSASAPLWLKGAAAGAGAVVPAVALGAAIGLLPASWKRAGAKSATRTRWVSYVVFGVASGALIGPYLVLVLLACGLIEICSRRAWRPRLPGGALSISAPLIALPALMGSLGGVALVAFKVGTLSYGGGFVIIPLMQHDAVVTYHWMTGTQFLDAVALGQVTPGPVVLTVAVVGYAAAGIGGALLATTIAFAPSFIFVLAGGRHFDRLRGNRTVQTFLTGAGAAVIGGIAGSAIPLGLALTAFWQLGVLVLGLIWVLALRRSIVPALLGGGALGVVAALIGLPIAR
ncbi:MAG TPA: chromate efflux transporter [Galbitalea sp.]|jgi:chromate transporter